MKQKKEPFVVTIYKVDHGYFQGGYGMCGCPLYDQDGLYCRLYGINDIKDCPLLQGREIIIRMEDWKKVKKK